MSEVVLNAAKRGVSGKKYAKQLRREGKIPGIFYTRNEKSIPLIFDLEEVQLLLRTEIGLFDLKIEKKKNLKCIVKEMQFDPVSNKLLHLDVMGVKLEEKINVTVPVHIVGEAVGAKDEGGILNQTLYELDVNCLPLDIPEHIDIEVSDLKVGDTIHVSDIKLENVEILNEPEVVVVGVVLPRAAKEEEEAEEELVEPTEDEEEKTEEDAKKADKER